MTTSFIVHVALLLWITTLRQDPVAGTMLAEIEYVSAAAAAPAAVASVDARPVAVEQPAESREHFRRSAPEAETAPEPQSDFALADRISSRLESLRNNEPGAAVVNAASPVTSRWSAATVGEPVRSAGTSVDLRREGAEGAPLALHRGTPASGTADPATIATRIRKPEEPQAASSHTATRQLAGAQLSGPVADRPILVHPAPVYPEWAKSDAVEGSVTLHFIVRPDGSIKENILVERTAGFDDFDQSAVTALRVWRFQPLAAGRTGEQWGSITFHFRLRDAG